jgi:hypothetical protein
MEREYHLETYDRCNVEKAESLIVGLQHDIRQLELSIAAEEDRVGYRDPSHYAYPFTARMMTTRCINLRATRAAIERRLGG